MAATVFMALGNRGWSTCCCDPVACSDLTGLALTFQISAPDGGLALFYRVLFGATVSDLDCWPCCD
jgi:hypothetical protein